MLPNPSSLIKNEVRRHMARHGNLILIVGVMSILSLMILPLKPHWLDFFLAINIVGAITLLVTAVYINEAVSLSSFPTLLLMATLFRLSLNIASTRLILSEGEAGEIIHTFGEYAAAGNLAIGGVMFLILTIVQFIVVAKGSERVAEVAARFSLDALPGKQMSIDADLRAGMITADDAKAQREKLQKESRMYGALDGAMKFVKGDAIAGILITVINIVGGLIVGVLQRGMEIGDAVTHYSILTIGDGLISQIPSILIAVTAGFVVTKVGDPNEKGGLGGEIGGQLLNDPRALLYAALVSALIGFIPGFPTTIFLILAAALAASALIYLKLVKTQSEAPLPLSHFREHHSPNSVAIGLATPFSVEVGPELNRLFETEKRWRRFFSVLYPGLRRHLIQTLGVPFPELRFQVSQKLSGSFSYNLKVFDVPVDKGMLTPHQCTVFEGLASPPPAAEPLEPPPQRPSGLAKITELQTTQTLHGTPIVLYESRHRSWLKEQGADVYEPEEMLLRHLAKILKKNAAEFIGIQEVRQILEEVERVYPELVREVVPKLMSIQKLTDIAKRLVEEEVPIRDFRLLLQILSQSQPEMKDPVTLTEQVRIGLRKTISHRYAVDGSLSVITLDPEVEEEIRNGIQKNGNECYLALNPERLQAITQASKNTLQQSYQRGLVAVTSVDIRRYYRKLIELDLPDLPVLSYQELDPRLRLNPVGMVVLGGA